jgi:hypothetical protein
MRNDNGKQMWEAQPQKQGRLQVCFFFHFKTYSINLVNSILVPSTPVTHRQSTSTPMFDFPEQGRQPESPSSSESDGDLPVNFDPLLLEPLPAPSCGRGGRPPKRQHCATAKRKGAKEPSQIPTPLVEKASTGRGDARRLKVSIINIIIYLKIRNSAHTKTSAANWSENGATPERVQYPVVADQKATQCFRFFFRQTKHDTILSW